MMVLAKARLQRHLQKNSITALLILKMSIFQSRIIQIICMKNPVLIYEDNVAGRLDDERFAMMSKNYTQEQKDYTSAMTS